VEILEACAGPEDSGIDRKDVQGLRHLIDPDLDFGLFDWGQV